MSIPLRLYLHTKSNLCFSSHASKAEKGPGAQLGFKWGGKKAQGGNGTGGEVWTFSSGCSPVSEAANVKRPGCEFPTEMGSVQRECKPISSLLSYLGTAAASICQLFMVATWGKRAPPLHFRRLLCCDREEFQALIKSVGLLRSLSVNMCACLFWWNAHWHRAKKKKHRQTTVSTFFLYTSGMIFIMVRS